jgi:hypothetical protein
MRDYLDLFKVLGDAGSTGLLIYVIYRLLSKWAGPFLAAQQAQAEAMTSQATAMTKLAKAVDEGQGEQREVLLAVRTMATKLDDACGWMRDIDQQLRAKGLVEK